MSNCEPQGLGTRWKVAIAAAFGISIAGLSISISTSVDVDVSITPKEAREGWAGPEAVKEAAPIVAGMQPFRVVGAPQDNTRANVRLWEFAKQCNGGKHLPNIAQQIGDCVSWGAKNAADYLQCRQIASNPWVGKEFRPAFAPYIYGTSRVQIGRGRISGDGSVGAWAADAVQTYGVLDAQYEGVPEYTGRVAKTWGRRGPPEEFIKHAKQFCVKTVAPVRSAAEVRDAVCNGYPVTIASNWGGKMRPDVVDGRLVNKRSGTWNHQMCIIGYDGETGSEPYYYVLNSWGAAAHGTPPDDAPPGGFWIRTKDVEYIVRQGDSFAFSDFDGFPAQELDFRIIRDGAQIQGGNVMQAGMSLFALSLVAFAFIFVSIVKRWVLHWWRLPVVACLLVVTFTSSARGDEPLNWNIMGTPAVTDEGLDFNIMGTLPLEAAIAPAKPVMKAYKDMRSVCPACVVLQSHEKELPFDLDWKQAPQWVKSYPTTEWRAADGRRLYFVLGVHGDRKELVRRWEWSMRQPAGGGTTAVNTLTGGQSTPSQHPVNTRLGSS